MLAGVTDHGGLVAKLFMANWTLKRFFTRMLTEMIVEVDPRFKGFIAGGTGKITDVFVMRPDVGGQATGLAKGFAAVFATNLPANPVSSQVVT